MLDDRTSVKRHCRSLLFADRHSLQALSPEITRDSGLIGAPRNDRHPVTGRQDLRVAGFVGATECPTTVRESRIASPVASRPWRLSTLHSGSIWIGLIGPCFTVFIVSKPLSGAVRAKGV